MVPRMEGPLGIQNGSKARNIKHHSNVGNSINQFMYLDSNLCMGFLAPPIIAQILVIKKKEREIRENDPYAP